MQQLITDEFDAAEGIGGKHLAPKRPLDYIVSFLTLTVVSGLIAGGGLVGLRLWDASIIFTGSASTQDLVTDETPLVPQTAVAIVDGTNTSLAQAIGDTLRAVGWNIVSAVSLAELDPNLSTSPTTLIFITAEEHRATAELLLIRFPEATIQVSGDFADPVTVLIGTDYLN